jgi:hypothetical protein
MPDLDTAGKILLVHALQKICENIPLQFKAGQVAKNSDPDIAGKILKVYAPKRYANVSRCKGGQVAERLSSEFRSGYSWQNFIGFCSTKDMHKYLVANGARLGRS